MTGATARLATRWSEQRRRPGQRPSVVLGNLRGVTAERLPPGCLGQSHGYLMAALTVKEACGRFLEAHMGDSTLKGRDAKTGQFIPVKDARERPNTTTVERVPKPGKGVK
jgi:hypothetical protein